LEILLAKGPFNKKGGDLISISFLRIDDRIIHGQIITRWAKEYPCDGIVAVHDRSASLPLIVATFKSAIDKPVFIWSYKEWSEKCDKVLQSEKKYFLITKDPEMMARILADDHFPAGPKQVVCGPINSKPNSRNLGMNISVNAEEAVSFEKIHNAGYDILFALVRETAIGQWTKFRSMFGYTS
jgi:mannose/fructose/N-acetylgalactosamine-specific phosphotransferase system component IIB